VNQLHELTVEADTGIQLTPYQRKMAENGLYVPLGHHKKQGWSGELPFYAWKCPTHGVVIDYPHGYWAPFKGTYPVKVKGVLSQLYCPLCSREEASKRTDPPKGADEPTQAKSVQGDENENDNPSKR